MILLESNDRFDDLAELNTSTGQVSWFSRRANLTAASRPVRGHIAKLHGRTLCLYREAGVLHFRVNNEDFELTEKTYVKLERIEDNVNRITVLRDGDEMFTWTYRRPVIEPPLEIDPTPFVEEEHFDFCLFVYNVAGDPSRRERIYTERI